MSVHTSGTTAAGLAAMALLVGVGCGNRAGSDGMPVRATQAEVSAAVQHVSQTVASVIEPRSSIAADTTARAPELSLVGTGLAAQLAAREDASHQDVRVARADDGWAVAWSDREHSRAYFARADAAGRVVATPTLVREARSNEEEVWSPAVAFNGRGYGVAWSDPANGRVRFARFTAEGQPEGAISTVHLGLEMPLATRVVWTGSEYGVGVALANGVYFARVAADGARVGRGVLVAEGGAVASLDELNATPTGFALVWHDSAEGGARHEARLSREGQLLGARGASLLRLASR